jgi:hypothetical protein
MWILFAFAFCSLIMPAAALDDKSQTPVYATITQHTDIPNPASFYLAVLFHFGCQSFALSGALAGPLMGITSILWLVKRNDTAINPKLSWM